MEKIIVISENELDILIQKSVKKVLNEQSIKANSDSFSDKIFSIKEAANFLNLAIQTLYGFTSKREIPFMKKGKKLYFKESELLNWLEEGKKKSVKEILESDSRVRKKERTEK